MHLNSWSNLWFLLAPDDGGGSGEDEDEESDVRNAGFAKMAARYKEDATGLAKDLYSDNYKLRTRNKKLTDDLTAAKTLAPAQGSVVLTADQAQAFAAYQALGTPEQVKQAVEERGSLQGRLDTIERETGLQRAATLAGYNFDVLKDADALTERSTGKKPSFIVKETVMDGAKVETPYIKIGDEETPLADYAQSNWGRLLPSLQSGSESNTQSQSSNGGTRYPAQHQGSGGGGNTSQKPVDQAKATLDKKYPKKSA